MLLIMKRSVTTILFALFMVFFGFFGNQVFAQDRRHQKEVEQLLFRADDHYSRQDYYSAAQEYEAIAAFAPSNSYAAYQLAESYRHYFEYEKAELWYQKTLSIDAENEHPLCSYWYANMLKMNGNYVDSEKAFEVFLSTFVPSGPEQDIFLEYALLDYNGCVLALDELSKPYRDYEFVNLGKHVNTDHLEFAPSIFGSDSTIVITSSREGSKGEEQFNMFGESYCDNYLFEYGKHGWKQHHQNHFDVLNTVRNDGSGVLHPDGSKFYYTICDENTGGECAIYVAKFDGHRWHKPDKLNENVNPEDVWNAQPSLSTTGDTMFFVSKREGGFGDNDIWYTINEGGESWGVAVNLGSQVNTPFVDMCPDYHPATRSLFFASNGHEGFGGLDIFQARDVVGGVHNLGLPFNSNRDDFYFVLGENKGYMASNREAEDAQGHDDIYWFNYNSDDTFLSGIDRDTSYESMDIEGVLLTAETREPVSEVSVFLTENGDILLATETDSLGKFRFQTIDAKRDYLLKLEEGNPNLTEDIRYILDQLKVTKTQVPVTRSIFENIYFDFDKSYVRPEAKRTMDLLVNFQRNNPNVQIELKGNTDSKGSSEYNDRLSQRRSRSAYEYLIAQGFPRTALVTSGWGEETPIASNKNEIGRQLNRRVEFFIRGGQNVPNSEFMTYIIEKRTNIKKVAERFGMTVTQIKEANNLKSNRLRKFRPLRVLRGASAQMIAQVSLDASNMDGYNVPDNTTVASTGRGEDVVIVLTNRRNGGLSGTGNQGGVSINQHNKYTQPNGYNLDGNKNVVAQDGEEIYVVKPLDILARIASQYNMTVANLKELNGLVSNRIQIGQRLRVKKAKI